MVKLEEYTQEDTQRLKEVGEEQRRRHKMMEEDEDPIKVALSHDKEDFVAVGIKGLEGKILAVFVRPKTKDTIIPPEIKRQFEAIFNQRGYLGKFYYSDGGVYEYF